MAFTFNTIIERLTIFLLYLSIARRTNEYNYLDKCWQKSYKIAGKMISCPKIILMRKVVMMQTGKETENRLLFLDNLRLFLVLCVVLEHSSHAYTHMMWWPVSDYVKSHVAGWLSAFTDAFAMPILFYIAGYFAIPTILKKGITAFYIGKLKRLGIPWLVCIMTICPIVPLVFHYTRNNFSFSMSYWELWRDIMLNAFEFDVGIIYSMNELMKHNLFYQRYMWFLSLLLLFFLLFGIVYAINSSWFKQITDSEPTGTPNVRSTLKILISVGGLTVLCSFATVGAMFSLAPELSNPEPLFTFGNIIQFRPSRLFFFIIYFILGILTFKYKWIERGTFPGHFQTWLIAFCVSTVAFFCARHLMVNGPDNLEEIFGAVFFLTLNFLSISVLGLSVSLALKHWNRPTRINQNLAASSYNIYLAHYPFVIVFQLILLDVPGLSGLVKFGMVAGLSIFCSYLFSEFVTRPRPKIAGSLAVSLFVIMVLVVRP